MRLLSYNIQYGFGQDGRYDLTRAAAVIRDADIAALQEVDRHWSRTNHDDQPAVLAASLPDHYAAYAPGYDMEAATPQDRNRRRQFGPMILSRWPILWTRTHLLPLDRMLDPLNIQTCALEAYIATPGGPLRVISLHLAHVGVQEQLAQIDHLLRATDPGQGGPWSGTDDEPDRNWTESQPEPPCPASAIWLGDFNMEPGSAEYLRLTHPTPYHPGARYARSLIDALIDTVALTGTRLHTHDKMSAGRRHLRQLDHCLVTPDLAPRVIRCWTSPDETASDHLPLWTDLSDED